MKWMEIVNWAPQASKLPVLPVHNVQFMVDRNLLRIPVQYRRAEISPIFSTGACNNLWEFSGIYKENSFQFWLFTGVHPNATAPVVVPPLSFLSLVPRGWAC